MIELERVKKVYRTRDGEHTVLRDVSLKVRPGDRIGVLGRNGSGKSTLIRLISGAELPSRGTVRRAMSVSWPLAFGGAFQGSLTGLDNLKFICRIYGADPSSKAEFVEDFAELGSYWREPVMNYSSGMRARLAFAISMAIEFDCFLVDEVIAVGDARFQEKCRQELFEKRLDRAMLVVSHDPNVLRETCQRACVLDQSSLMEFEDLQSAYDFYEAINAQATPVT